MEMTSPLTNVLKSRVLLFVLVLGNVALGLTTVAQSSVIANQKELIHLLYSDSAELAGMKIAANMAKAKKH